MAEGLSDADIGLSDEDIGLGPQAQSTKGLSDADIGLSDADIGLGPQSESFIPRLARNVAHGILPAAGAVVGGAALGTAIGGPVGTLVGGIVGGIGGGAAADIAQDKLQDAIPAIDDRAQYQANQEAHPIESAVEGMLPFAGSPAGKVGQRVAQGAMLGGLDLVQQGYQKGISNIDPAQSAAVAGFGAAFPGGNRATQALHEGVARRIPGRPNKVENNPDAEVAHEAVGVDNSLLGQSPRNSADSAQPPVTDADKIAVTGTPIDNVPVNSHGDPATGKADGSYAKDQPPAGDQSTVTKGDIDPATQAALGAVTGPEQYSLDVDRKAAPVPKPEDTPEFPHPGELLQPSGEGQPAVRPPVRSDEGLIEASRAQRRAVDPNRDRRTSTEIPPEPDQYSLDVDRKAAPAPKPEEADVAGFPHPGELLHPGSTDAAKPPAVLAKEAERPAPEKDGKLFGKNIMIETRKGETRSGVNKDGTPWTHELPYDYGYIDDTISTDKEHTGEPGKIDLIRAVEGTPEHHGEGKPRTFLVDQKNPLTGEYDEPKIITNVKDRNKAIALYNKGFGDKSGPTRMHDITELNAQTGKKYLEDHTSKPPEGPFSKKPLKLETAGDTPAGRKAAENLKKAGREAEAEKLLATPATPAVKQALQKNIRTRKSNQEIPGMFSREGKPLTAPTIADAHAKAAAHQKVVEWFHNSAPKGAEDDGTMLDRLKTGLPASPGAGLYEGGAPRPAPKEWELMAAAKKLLNSPTPANKKKFRDLESKLRGDQTALEQHYAEKAVEGQARNQKTGDLVVEKAQNAKAAENVYSTQDEMAEYLDAKKAAEAEAKAEADKPGTTDTVEKAAARADKVAEAKEKLPEPKKAVAAKDSKLAKAKSVKAKPVTAAVKEAPKPAPEVKSLKEGKIQISDDETQRILANLAKATQKGKTGWSPDEIARQDVLRDMPDAKDAPERPTKAAAPALSKYAALEAMANKFLGDDNGSLNINKIKSDFDKLLSGVRMPKWGSKTPKPPKPPEPPEPPEPSEPSEPSEPRKGFDMSRTKYETYRPKWGPMGDREAYVESLDQDLHRNGKLGINHVAGLIAKAKQIGKISDQKAREELFHARDADRSDIDLPGKLPGKTNVESLTGPAKELWDGLKPLFDINDQIFKESGPLAADMGQEQPIEVANHIAHIQQGDTPKWNPLINDNDPMRQGSYNRLRTTANSAKDLSYFILKDGNGKRFVVEPQSNGTLRLWDKYKSQDIKSANFKFTKPGEKFTIESPNGNIDFTMHHASALEKEANVMVGKGENKKPIKYFKDAAFSGIMTNSQLAERLRNLQLLHEITNSDKWKDWATQNPTDKRVLGEVEGHDKWEKTNLENFKGWYMHPDLKALLDDFAGHPETGLQRLNEAVTKLIFVSPTPHIFNQLVHMVVDRSWDNFNPIANYKMARDFFPVMQDVLKQGPYQRALNRAAAGTVYGSYLTREPMQQFANALGLHIKENPGVWGKPLETLGVSPGELARAVVRTPGHMLWAGNDLILSLRVRELERKGLSMEDAVREAERGIPNYRTMTKMFGQGKLSRAATQKFFDSSFFAFSRYHAGMLNAYANTLRDGLSKNATTGDRVHALGNLVTMGMLGMVFYPLMDKMYQTITGNENAEAPRRGALTIPSRLKDVSEGLAPPSSALSSVLTMSPAVQTGIETLTGRDWRGQQIIEPGDVREAFQGHAAGAARAAGSAAGHAVRGLVPPANMYATEWAKNRDQGVLKTLGKTIRDQALDIKDVSDAAAKYRRQIAKTSNANIKREMKKPNDPMQQLINEVFGR